MECGAQDTLLIVWFPEEKKKKKKEKKKTRRVYLVFGETLIEAFI
jgi:hypothetical protein